MKNKVNELLKTIFYLPHFAYLLSKANFKIDHTRFSKLCLLKCTALLEKQHFRIFQHSNIRNETRRFQKNNFLSSTLCISVKVSKNKIFEFFSTKIFVMKLDDSRKTIFYLSHYASLLNLKNINYGHVLLI